VTTFVHYFSAVCQAEFIDALMNKEQKIEVSDTTMTT
jgi:hypothetical protein